MFTEFKLVRDPTRPNAATPYPKFGDLLKAKATEGVRVLCMVWDDRTSVDYGMINTGASRSLSLLCVSGHQESRCTAGGAPQVQHRAFRRFPASGVVCVP